MTEQFHVVYKDVLLLKDILNGFLMIHTRASFTHHTYDKNSDTLRRIATLDVQSDPIPFKN